MALNFIRERTTGYPEWSGESLSDFDEWVSKVSNRNNTVFRGQRKYRPLLPSIGRNHLSNDILNIENKMFSLFKNDAKRCLHLIPRNDWDWLVVAQHHGLPTRIMDFSYKPYVALWFALKDHQKKDSRPEVWTLKPISGDIIDSLEKSRPFQGTRTKLFDTEFRIPRIKEQNGCFVLFKYIKKSDLGFIPLEENRHLRGKIEKITIMNYAAKKMLKQIEKKGVTKEKLFPDIDRVAESIKNRNYKNYENEYG